MDGIPTAPGGPGVPTPPAGSVPPAPVAPGAPPAPPARRRTGLIVALVVVAVLMVGGIAAAVSAGRDDGVQAAPSTSRSVQPTPTGTGSAPAGAVPDEIGGVPRMTGTQGDAMEELVRGFAEQDSLAVGVYGTMVEPRYMYVVVGTSAGMETLPLEEFLDLMAAGAGSGITGDVARRTDGDVEAACGTIDDPTIGFMCVTIDPASVDTLIGFRKAPADEQLELAIAAAA